MRSFSYDSLGSAQTGTDSSGEILWQEAYTPYGEALNDVTANQDLAGFTGHIKDDATGLSYMQARYYDPVIGRFYSNDPIGFRDVHRFNRYVYANNNPYKFVDPDGKETRLAQREDIKVRELGKGNMTMDEFNPPETFPSSGTEAGVIEFNLAGGGSVSLEAGFVKDSNGNKGIQLSVQYGGGTPEVSLEAGKELTSASNISELNGASGIQTISVGEGIVGSGSIIFAPTYKGGLDYWRNRYWLTSG
ncbi:RHS repeat-associated core domain-containing protein [Pseudidiomarina aquimaris]|uniref:RHS repeat-associated core domain-containing protein n=1 Tax=Pseudidiomarina aquimaris TaxID=641841 RepID=UPI003A96F812